MIKKTLKTLKRAPVRALAVLLFAAVITMIICSLHASNEAELRNYEEVWQSVPITVTVTEPSGVNSDMFLINTWVYELFTKKDPQVFYDVSEAKSLEERVDLISDGDALVLEVALAEYIKDVQVRMSRVINKINAKDYKSPNLIGISSLSCDKQLLPEYGCDITWHEGYDESIFDGEQFVCIIPAGTVEDYDNGSGEVVLDFSNTGTPTVTIVDGKPVVEINKHEYQCTFKIVGTYTAGDEKSIYCPVPIVEQIVISELEEPLLIYSLSATLADNNRLDEFREKSNLCFIEPTLDAEETPWGYDVQLSKSDEPFRSTHYDFYPFALDINDDNLFDLSAILEDSIKFNRNVTVMVVALSVVAGFLVGFLMIRRRKRDILLMRMVGESNARVYAGFALEQMICIILGIVIGGAYYNWNPINNLAIFAVSYFIALSLALTIFMSKKLIKNVKEDE
ncbi:MAG: ABC transporter permease [Clostridia bacterium]|nr:ABC transporter permease [Clostridia bacterium]